MISFEDAALQGKVLSEAAASSPLPSVAAVLFERGKEYTRAANDADTAIKMGKQVILCPVGTIEVGMTVLYSDDARVLRVIRQQGDISLQVLDEGIVKYMNFISATSPVVVIV